MSPDPEVVVVGAGLAGLTAAGALAGHGHRVVVVEASDRVGGRIAAHMADGEALDAGGAYTGHLHHVVRGLAHRAGIGLVPTTAPGEAVFDLRGTVCRTAGPPPLNALALGGLFDLLEDLAARVCLAQPAATPDAGRLDMMAVADWAESERLHPDARLALTLIVREMLAVEPSGVSLLHLLFYIRSGGGIGYLTAFSGGAQQDRFAGGAERLAIWLGDRLPEPPVLGTAVRELTVHPDGVTVVADGLTLTAQYALVTVPAGLDDQLAIQPSGLAIPDRQVRGSAIKIHVVYDEPFWHEAGLSGWITCDTGPLCFVVDDSAERGGRGVLTGFITGDAARQFQRIRPAGRRAAVLARLTRWLGPAAACPRDFRERDWSLAAFTAGCYAAVPKLGDWVRRPARPDLRPPGKELPRLCWAGSERSPDFYGHLEGAARSGLEQARAIDRALAATGPTP
jgi:monoamine oxidase